MPAISEAGGEDAAYIGPGGVLAAGTDSSATYPITARMRLLDVGHDRAERFHGGSMSVCIFPIFGPVPVSCHGIYGYRLV